MAIKDEKVILIEVKAHVNKSDVTIFRKKAELYERVTGKRVDRLIVVSPYVDEGAFEACRELGIEVCTSV